MGGIKARILSTMKALDRMNTFLKPMAPNIAEIWEHIQVPGHVITIAFDKLGCQIYICHLGGFFINRDEYPDPFAFDYTEDPQAFLENVCEMFMNMRAHK
jgi:hypothetical protein